MHDDHTTIRQDGAALALRPQAASLRILSGARAGEVVSLKVAAVTIGRGKDADLCLDDAALSRAHACVTPGPKGWKIQDLGSANGTWLDGARVEVAFLMPGATIRVGDQTLRFEVERKISAPAEGAPLPGVLGSSPAMTKLRKLIRKVGPTGLAVFLAGESGTGKELLARALHETRPDPQGPYEVVDCTLLRDEHLRSELFGHVKGAFTGADQARKGAFERAHGGTLFLDEVGELPLDLQPTLLRVLETGEVRPLGGNKPASVNVRVVAASHRDLEAMVAAGDFREDLYYRLAAVRVDVPPLRARGQDASELAEHFLPSGLQLSADARAALAAHAWPGNVRELRNALQRAAALAEGGVVEVEDLGLRTRPQAEPPREPLTPPGHRATPSSGAIAGTTATAGTANLQDVELDTIRRVLDECGGNRTEAARRLGISRSTLYAKLRKLGLGD